MLNDDNIIHTQPRKLDGNGIFHAVPNQSSFQVPVLGDKSEDEEIKLKSVQDNMDENPRLEFEDK